MDDPVTSKRLDWDQLDHWVINRKLEKLERNYQCDQEKKPAEIESSSVANPRGAAIGYMVERLKQYVGEIKSTFESEIEAGRVADTPDLWAAVYSQKILPSVLPKINSLVGNLAFRLMRTGGDGVGEKATVEEVQRELSRLRAGLERELACARKQATTRNKATSTEKLRPSPEIPFTDQPRTQANINRALLVEKIRREMREIADALELPEDYDARVRTNQGFAQYTTVVVCNRHPDLREKLCAIKTTKKPRIVDLACEIAVRSGATRIREPIGKNTFKDAHRRYGSKARSRLDPPTQAG
jgi:hypothetical protein